MKVCKACGEEKPLEEFHRQPGGRHGRAARCKVCRKLEPGQRSEYQRAYYLRNRPRVLKREADRYRADPEFRKRKSERARQWDLAHPDEVKLRQRKAMAKRYGLTPDELGDILARGCALCEATEDLHIDHCHTTGKVRDALCRSCNTGLGHFGDDPARLRAAADYLQKHRST